MPDPTVTVVKRNLEDLKEREYLLKVAFEQGRMSEEDYLRNLKTVREAREELEGEEAQRDLNATGIVFIIALLIIFLAVFFMWQVGIFCRYGWCL